VYPETEPTEWVSPRFVNGASERIIRHGRKELKAKALMPPLPNGRGSDSNRNRRPVACCTLLGWCALALALPLAAATVPRASPSDYPAQSSRPELVLAGEFYGRSAPTRTGTIFTGHYVVVEVAVYPARGQRVTVHPSELRLFINGAKYGLLPQSGSVVAGTLKWYGYEREPGVQIGGGVGPIYIPSQPRQGPNFPGDPTDRQPTRPKAPEGGQDPNGNNRADKRVAEDPAEALPQMELESGETLHPVSGYLYFYWPAHTKKLRNVELRWETMWGKPPRAVLKLVSPR